MYIRRSPNVVRVHDVRILRQGQTEGVSHTHFWGFYEQNLAIAIALAAVAKQGGAGVAI
jgi:hypothetical protein